MGLLDPKPQTQAGLDAAVTAKATTGGTALNAALSATYGRTYRPEAYGAVGDGVANDLPAFQAIANAINAEPTKPAKIEITGKHYLANGISFDGENIECYLAAGSHVFTTAATNVGHTLGFIGYLGTGTATTPARARVKVHGPGKVTGWLGGGTATNNENAIGVVRYKNVLIDGPQEVEAGNKGFTAQYGIDHVVVRNFGVKRANFRAVSVEDGTLTFDAEGVSVASTGGGGVIASADVIKMRKIDITEANTNGGTTEAAVRATGIALKDADLDDIWIGDAKTGKGVIINAATQRAYIGDNVRVDKSGGAGMEFNSCAGDLYIGGKARNSPVAISAIGQTQLAAIKRPAFARQPRALGNGFSRTVLDNPSTGTSRYAGMPGICTTKDGDLLVLWRRAGMHDVGGDPGVAYWARSSDGGLTWGTTTLAFQVAGSNIQDLYLSRFGDDRRIYASYHRTGDVSATTVGSYVRYSDDDGANWSVEYTVEAGQVAQAGKMQRSHDGDYLLPSYIVVGGVWQSVLHRATDPLGVWTRTVVSAIPAVNCTEWNFVQVSSTNWVALFRQASADPIQVRQSTDGGVTWSAATAITGLVQSINIGWPMPMLLDDGSVLAWYKSSGSGVRSIQLMDVTQPLVASEWKDVQAFPAAGLDNGTVNTGKIEVVRFGDGWKVAYYGEDPADDVNRALVKLASFKPQMFRAVRSYVATTETTNFAATPYATLTTPDRVKVRSRGEFYRINWQVESFSSATIENWNAAVYIDDVFQNDTSQLAIGASTQSASASAYHNAKETTVWLTPGLHTIELRFRVQTGTVARSIRQRLLAATPLAP